MADDHFEKSYAEQSWQERMLRVRDDLDRIASASREAITQSQASIALADEIIAGRLIGHRIT